MGFGDEGFELSEVDLDRPGVLGVRVGPLFGPVLFPSLGPEEGPCERVARKDGRRRAELGAHVGEGCAFRDVQVLQAGAEVFQDIPHPALDAQAAQQFQHQILGAHGRPALPGEADAHDLGHFEVEGLSSQDQGAVQPPTPMANMPTELDIGVWLSAPIRT